MIRLTIILAASVAVWAQAPAQAPAPASGARDLAVTVGKSVLVDSPAVIERVAVANGTLVEAVAITPHEVLVNGKAAGETTMIVWQQGGNRLFFDLTVQRNDTRLNEVRHLISEEKGAENVQLDVDGDSVLVRGTAADLTSADRAMSIAGTLGKAVNLLRVNIPQTDQQILLKVRFADVDRSVSQSLGINFLSGNPKLTGSTTTGQFGPPTLTGNVGGSTGGSTTSTSPSLTLTQALNIFLFRPDINIGATISALQSQNLLEILAEPNVMAINGHTATFLDGGQFPYPTIQGGVNAGAVTISFREFGIKIEFTPTVTPRGTIRLQVTPEVSSLDYTNALIYNGITVPGIATKRVQTEIELEDGQSFAIGGMLNNQETETLNKVPGLGDIPFFGKLFQSRIKTKNNSELLVLVTPEMVHPIPRGVSPPELHYPTTFMPPNTPGVPMRTPVEPAEARKTLGSIPVEQLIKSQQPPKEQGPQVQYVPMVPVPGAASVPGAAPAPPSAPAAGAPQQ
jgi:pilus assembly protein CpaC